MVEQKDAAGAPWRLRLALALAGPHVRRLQAGVVSSRVEDGPGWQALTGRPHERDAAEIEALYNDSLTAWRKNPLAKRAVDIIADYVVGDGITLTSPFPPLQAFIDAFWHHPRNQLPHRLETMCHELTLAGDLFPLLFRNPHDGMSYLRFVTKDRIARVETAPDDWETETAYVELPRAAGGPETRWAGAGALRHDSGGRRGTGMAPLCSIMRSTGRWARCWARGTWRR